MSLGNNDKSELNPVSRLITSEQDHQPHLPSLAYYCVWKIKIRKHGKFLVQSSVPFQG